MVTSPRADSPDSDGLLSLRSPASDAAGVQAVRPPKAVATPSPAVLRRKRRRLIPLLSSMARLDGTFTIVLLVQLVRLQLIRALCQPPTRRVGSSRRQAGGPIGRRSTASGSGPSC